jgi:hypothetical protein
LYEVSNFGNTVVPPICLAAYMNGNGVSKDPAQAKKWLKKAHEHGSTSAEDICGCKF